MSYSEATRYRLLQEKIAANSTLKIGQKIWVRKADGSWEGQFVIDQTSRSWMIGSAFLRSKLEGDPERWDSWQRHALKIVKSQYPNWPGISLTEPKEEEKAA